MRRRNKSKNNLLILLLVLIILGVGIGYAVLSERLTIDNTISYDSMKWDVSFTAAEDGFENFFNKYIEFFERTNGVTLEEMGMTREEFENAMLEDMMKASATASISSDKKSITTNCNLEMSSKSQICVVKATISNASTFNIALSDNPTLTYDDTYIDSVSVFWINHSLFELEDLAKGQTLDAGEIVDVTITILTKELTTDILPTNGLSVPITISLDFEEAEVPISKLAMLISRKDDFAFWSDTYKDNIKNISFEDKINIPNNAVESWDISVGQKGKVMSYIVPNKNDSSYYDLYIQSDTQLYANINMRYWFYDFENVDSINGLNLLDTSYTIDMYGMFMGTGEFSTIFTLDVSNFDTSNVTDMALMFADTGSLSTIFTVDVSNFDTSNVTDMDGMFLWTGLNSTQFVTTITIRNPNTTECGSMFYGAATKPGSKITVNYTSETESLVDDMIATKTDGANVVKGVQVD